MSLKENRAFSFVLIFLIYVHAIFVGVATFCSLSFDVWLNLLIADVVSTLVTFAFSVLLKNASVYDPYWSVQPMIILIAFSISKPLNAVQILPLIAVMLWGIRLTINWAYTFHGLKHEDWRYRMLAEKTGKFYFFINLFGIHLVPTLIVYLCILPAVYLMFDPNLTANVGTLVFFAVSIFAVMLQGTADFQMHKFRKSKVGGFMRNGLWKYSRHPNYFGEILMWWGIGFSAICMYPEKLYFLTGAFLNTMLFLFVSIPMADNRQAQKEGFEQYKQETRMLLPIKK